VLYINICSKTVGKVVTFSRFRWFSVVFACFRPFSL